MFFSGLLFMCPASAVDLRLLFLLPKVKPEIVTIGRKKRRLRIIGWCGLSFPQDHRREWRFGFAVPKANLERFKWSQTPTSGYRPLVLAGTCGITTHRLSWCIKAYINFLLPIQIWPWTFLGKEYTQLLWEELVLRPNFWVALAIEKKKKKSHKQMYNTINIPLFS